MGAARLKAARLITAGFRIQRFTRRPMRAGERKRFAATGRDYPPTGRDVPTPGRVARTVRKAVLISGLILLGAVTAAALPEWVDSYGAKTPYPETGYYTGFGFAERGGDDAKALEAAKVRAKADLISKIRVQIRSTITSRESTGSGRSTVEATAVSESVAVLEIENAAYDVEKNLRNIYALARVRKDDLARMYRKQLDDELAGITGLREKAKGYEADGDNAAALRVYASLASALQNAYRIVGLLETVLRGSNLPKNVFPVVSGDETITEDALHGMGAEIEDTLESLRYGSSGDLDSAMDLMLVQLEDQEIPEGRFRVSNLTFEDSDYSSAFGSWAAGAIETAIARGYTGDGPDRIVRGSYWIEGEEIVLRLIVQSPQGEISGSSMLRFPAQTVPEGIELRPRNFEQALVDQREIVSGAVVDGGISIEVWTNKGGNADRLVFTEGDTIQFYFRVNQPSYLQLTYFLTTGERVLLDESFYIGRDKVNLVVRYPYEFEPVPPFGVERLVVTAYEDPPPKPSLLVRTIEGIEYRVFGSTGAVYAATRGIRPKADKDPEREVRVGEAVVTMTTAAAAGLR